MVFQVSCLDSLGRAWIVGYSCCSLPVVPGHHVLDVPCWLPTASTLTDRIREYFLGGSHQLLQSDIINLGTDRFVSLNQLLGYLLTKTFFLLAFFDFREHFSDCRFKLKTQSKGTIKLHIDLVLRNFSQFGVEYK